MNIFIDVWLVVWHFLIPEQFSIYFIADIETQDGADIIGEDSPKGNTGIKAGSDPTRNDEKTKMHIK